MCLIGARGVANIYQERFLARKSVPVSVTSAVLRKYASSIPELLNQSLRGGKPDKNGGYVKNSDTQSPILLACPSRIPPPKGANYSSLTSRDSSRYLSH